MCMLALLLDILDLVKQVKFLRIILFSLYIGLVETDPEGALAGFAEVVQMEQEKAEW